MKMTRKGLSLTVIISVLLTGITAIWNGYPKTYLKLPINPSCTTTICPMFTPPQNWNPEIISFNLMYDLAFWFLLCFVVYGLYTNISKKGK